MPPNFEFVKRVPSSRSIFEFSREQCSDLFGRIFSSILPHWKGKPWHGFVAPVISRLLVLTIRNVSYRWKCGQQWASARKIFQNLATRKIVQRVFERGTGTIWARKPFLLHVSLRSFLSNWERVNLHSFCISDRWLSLFKAPTRWAARRQEKLPDPIVRILEAFSHNQQTQDLYEMRLLLFRYLFSRRSVILNQSRREKHDGLKIRKTLKGTLR